MKAVLPAALILIPGFAIAGNPVCALSTSVIDLPFTGSSVHSKPAVTASGAMLEHVMSKSTRQIRMTCPRGARVEVTSPESDGAIQAGTDLIYQRSDVEIESADNGVKIAVGELGRRPVSFISDGAPLNMILTSYLYTRDGRAVKALSINRTQNINFAVF